MFVYHKKDVCSMLPTPYFKELRSNSVKINTACSVADPDLDLSRSVFNGPFRICPDPYSMDHSGSGSVFGIRIRILNTIVGLLPMGCKTKLIGIIHEICLFFYKRPPWPMSITGISVLLFKSQTYWYGQMNFCLP